MYALDPENAEGFFFSWAQGFMSGLNAASLQSQGQSRDLSSMPPEEQERFIRDYCNDHPLASYVTVVVQLYHRFRTSAPIATHE
jgi:hypothetical protein